ncbi:YceI family protein [Modestobacter sp. I12A-02628]|uniref:YceI family protein n=1 Tax=Goekera deserti TaxID=2497753 RepID=A0A7K3WGD7_9ACTN|nr:YceI family protein [Goekera deserti]MPQ98005.1 YceI family protein [Goekera deserti]NDI48652.1 YceI family protein [Goekera deserti]NEL54969.1 YceI family protein [Goekera deserti]
MPTRRTWLISGGVAAVLVVGAVAGPLVYAATQEDAAPARTVQAQPSVAAPSGAAPADAGTGVAPVAGASVDGTWTIGAGSTAGYRVDEVLNGADVTVAGTTEQVSGQVEIVGGDLTTGEIVVDMASVTTDSDRRDGYFRDNVMDVDANPTGTFRFTSPVDLPELTGQPVTVPVSGEMTLAGVTQPVQTEISVVRTADGVQASGSVPITFSDYDVQAPDLGFVSVEDAGSVEFFLTLTQ